MFISDEDYELIEKIIYLPLVLKILHSDGDIIRKAPFKMKEPYVQLIDQTIAKVEVDIIQTRQQLKERNITIVKKGMNDAFSLYEFRIQKQSQEHSYYHPVMKNQTQKLLHDYLFTNLAHFSLPK